MQRHTKLVGKPTAVRRRAARPAGGPASSALTPVCAPRAPAPAPPHPRSGPPGTLPRAPPAASPAGDLDDSFVSFAPPDLDPGSPDDAASNFKVVIRVRPPLPRELHGERPFANAVKVLEGGESAVVLSEDLAAFEESSGVGGGPYATHTFTFDSVYDQACDQRAVFEKTAQGVVESSLSGYNATILAVRALLCVGLARGRGAVAPGHTFSC